VTLLCDGGERYADSYYSDQWLAELDLDLAPHTERLQSVLATGIWTS
jgi:cysteine synthase A